MPGSFLTTSRSSLVHLLSLASERATWRAALPLLLSFAAVLAVGDLAASPVLGLSLLAFTFVAYGGTVSRLGASARPAAILAVAVALRFLWLPLPISLSDDLLRYVWDGRVLNAGFNPYELPPESGSLETLRDERWQKMPHKHVPTVYPPLALAGFSIASRSPTPLMALKILMAVADLLSCWLLLRLAAARGLPASRAAWYCWSPLACMETAGMGHVDALGVAAQIAAVLFVTSTRRRPALAALAGCAAVLTKIFPVIALPTWARHSGRPALFAAIALAVLAAAILPILVWTHGTPPGLVAYGVSWEFNGPLYEPLWRLFDLSGLDGAVKAGLDRLKSLTGQHEVLNRFYPLVYPQLMAKGLLAAIFFGFWLHAQKAHDPIVGTGKVFAAFLLTTATLYPWYLLWVLPWAALGRHRAWLVLQATVQISYLPQLIGAPHFPAFYLATWLPFFLLLGFSRWSTD